VRRRRRSANATLGWRTRPCPFRVPSVRVWGSFGRFCPSRWGTGTRRPILGLARPPHLLPHPSGRRRSRSPSVAVTRRHVRESFPCPTRSAGRPRADDRRRRRPVPARRPRRGERPADGGAGPPRRRRARPLQVADRPARARRPRRRGDRVALRRPRLPGAVDAGDPEQRLAARADPRGPGVRREGVDRPPAHLRHRRLGGAEARPLRRARQGGRLGALPQLPAQPARRALLPRRVHPLGEGPDLVAARRGRRR
jgi:hypothetical protein